MWIGRRVPRSHTAPTQAAVTSGSKQIWLTMYVANASFANIDLIVASSEMNAWLSGYPVIPTSRNGCPSSASASSNGRDP